jgi:hypothetical protein
MFQAPWSEATNLDPKSKIKLPALFHYGQIAQRDCVFPSVFFSAASISAHEAARQV